MVQRDRIAIGLALAALPVRFSLATCTDLSPDEAYYLTVSRLRLPFSDHGPLTPWLAGLFDEVPGCVELTTRVPSLVLGTVLGLTVIEWVRSRGGGAVAQRWAALLGSWMALPLAGGFLLTPDAPMLTATLALALLLREPLGHEAETRLLRYARLAGITTTCFLGTLAKVSMLLPVAAAFAASRSKSERVAVSVGIALALPFVWSSLCFQLRHAFVSNGRAEVVVGAVPAVIAAFLAQAALWGPALILGGRKAWEHRFDRVLILSMTGLIVISSLARAVPPEPNWFAPAAIALVVGASHVMQRTHRWVKITTLMLGPVASLAFTTHVLHPWIPISTRTDPSARLHGWKTNHPPVSAPGVGPYGAASEACVYQDKCDKIIEIQNATNISSSKVSTLLSKPN